MFVMIVTIWMTIFRAIFERKLKHVCSLISIVNHILDFHTVKGNQCVSIHVTTEENRHIL